METNDATTSARPRPKDVYRRVTQMSLERPGTQILAIDTETTGLDPVGDEVLQLSAVDGTGATVMNLRFAPEWHSEWPDAMRINHITPESVTGLPSLRLRRREVSEILLGYDEFLLYNAPFDLGFLAAAGVGWSAHITDVRVEYSDWLHDNRNGQGRARLVDAAATFGYDGYDEKAHDALEDARATLYCHRAIHGLTH